LGSRKDVWTVKKNPVPQILNSSLSKQVEEDHQLAQFQLKKWLLNMSK